MSKERLVFKVVDRVMTPEEGTDLSLGPQGSWPLAPTTRFVVPLTLMNKERLVFEVADGVTTPEEGR